MRWVRSLWATIRRLASISRRIERTTRLATSMERMKAATMPTSAPVMARRRNSRASLSTSARGSAAVYVQPARGSGSATAT